MDHNLYFYRRCISGLNYDERGLFSLGSSRHYHGCRAHAYPGTRLNQEYDFAFRYYCTVEACHPFDPFEAHGAHQWSRDCRGCKSGDQTIREFGLNVSEARVGALNGRLQVVTAAERVDREVRGLNMSRGHESAQTGAVEDVR